jgi:hypothetical protein
MPAEAGMPASEEALSTAGCQY